MKALITVIVIFYFISPAFLFSQEIPNAVNYSGKIIGTSSTDGKPETGTSISHTDAGKISGLQKKITEIRKSVNPDFSEIENLQMQIASLTNQSIVKTSVFYPGQVTPSGMIEQFDAVGNTQVLSKINIKGIATATEFTGATAGRIWMVAGFQGIGTILSPDSLRVLYSTNNGSSWIPYASITLGGTDKINNGDIDVELIEGGTNKYLHIVYGLRANGGQGKWFAGGASIQLTGAFAGNVWALSWPGDDASKRYYCPRITSDNYVWPTSPWVYVAVSFDSAGASGRVNTQKFAQLNIPNTVSPAFMYKTSKIYWFTETADEQNLYTDIAFFQRNGVDTLIISYCGVSDGTKVFFSKMSANGMISPVNSGQYAGPIGGSEPNYIKYNGKLSSNGNNNGSIFYIFNQKSATTDGVKYFRTTNYGDFNDINQSVIWTAPNGVSMSDIKGVRGGNSHRFGFFFKNTLSDSLKYISVSNAGTFLSTSDKLNSVNFATGNFSPSIGLRFQANDSCFALYTAYGPVDVWSAQGCSGAITGIIENSTPVIYSLKQNFPNPFNPVTRIAYSLSSPQMVTLKIYNVLGKEVASPVNEFKARGNYEVSFDASELTSGIYFYKITAGNFTDTKKMVLVK
jgi:hypothetical protein